MSPSNSANAIGLSAMGRSLSAMGMSPSTMGRSLSTMGRSVATGGEQQGRNSTKRAAQNRAAQRAFRLRKEVYVRELERKAELLEQAKEEIIQLKERSRELEQELVRMRGRAGSILTSSQHPSRPQSPPHVSEPGSATNGNSAPAPEGRDSIDRRPEWYHEGKVAPTESRDTQDRHEDHGRPSGHLTISRHSSSHQLRHSYNDVPTSMTNGSSAHAALEDQTTQYPNHQQQKRPQPQTTRQGSESEYDNPHPLAHGRKPTDTIKSDKDGQECWGTMSDHKRESLDSRTEYHQPPLRGFHDTNSIHLEYPDSSTLRKGPPLHPISTATSEVMSRLPPAINTSSLSPVGPGGMVTATSPPIKSSGYAGHQDRIKKRSSDGSIWIGSKGLGHHSLPRSGLPGRGLQAEIRKQTSWSSFSVQTSPVEPRTPGAISGDMNADTDMHEPFHQQQPQQNSRHLQHRASTGSVSSMNEDRRFSGSNHSTRMKDSPEATSPDQMPGNGMPSLKAQAPCHSKQYFSHEQQDLRQHQHQQYQRRYPHSSEQEQLTGVYSSSPHEQSYPPSQYRHGHGQSMHNYHQ